MDIMEAIKARHSVRQYEGRPLAADAVCALEWEEGGRPGTVFIQRLIWVL